jgi:hypothetical protein
MGSVTHVCDSSGRVPRRATSFARAHTQHAGSEGMWVSVCGCATRALPLASGKSVPGGP